MTRPLIEAVIVSSSSRTSPRCYGDLLEETLPYTLRHVDRLVVVCSPNDKATHRACKRYDVTFLPTWVQHRGPSSFDKAAAINHGLAHLSLDGAVWHLDADIVIPDAFGTWIREHRPDKKCIYGIDRFDCVGWENWQKLQASGWLNKRREWGYLHNPPPFCNPTTRIGHGSYHGWLPCGFSQLWFPRESGIMRYPTKPNANGEHTDVLHAAQWEPESRRLITDFYVIHLTSEPNPMGRDWAGRKSPTFRNKPKPDDDLPMATSYA